MALENTVVGTLAVVAVCLGYLLREKLFSKPYPYPPGPKPLPVLGNILDMPSSYQHLKFTEWSERWGLSSFEFALAPSLMSVCRRHHLLFGLGYAICRPQYRRS